MPPSLCPMYYQVGINQFFVYMGSGPTCSVSVCFLFAYVVMFIVCGHTSKAFTGNRKM